MTLLEVLIGLSLITLLMSVLFSLYGSFFMLEKEVEKQKEINYLWSRMDSRLRELFSSSTPPKKKESFFFTTPHPLAQGNTLVFCYDNGNCVLPEFSNENIARLMLNENGELLLSSWPSPARHKTAPFPMLQEVLMEGVESFQMFFYTLPNGGSNKEGSLEEKGWRPFWRKDEERTPPLLQLILKEKGVEQPAVFFYALPGENTPLEIQEER